MADLSEVWAAIKADPAFDALRHSPPDEAGNRSEVRFVAGDGNPDHPAVAFIGEAPGADEDRIGIPFVGQAGRLLRDLINEHLGILSDGLTDSEDQVWITNVIKYRPPANRTPTWPERIAARPHLREEIKIVAPRIIVPLGATPLSLVGAGSITRARGKAIQRRNGRWVYFPMFHPAYLLRRRDLMGVAHGDFEALARMIRRLDEVAPR